MKTAEQLAKNLRDVYDGDHWTGINFKNTLQNVDWRNASVHFQNLNSIATISFHCTYYISALIRVLKGEPLNAKDELSFHHPEIESETDWLKFQHKILAEAEMAAHLIEQMPDEKLWDDFSDPKYGNYYRNISGMIEHLHYHLGQIVLINKLLVENNSDPS